MKKTILLLALFSAVLISCKKEKKEDLTPTPVVKDFAYIKAGTKWIYNTTDTDSSHAGIVIEQSFKIKTMDADGWCTVEWTLPSFVQQIEWFADATMFANMASKTAQMKFPLVKANPTLNDTYSVTFTTNTGTVTNTRKVVSLSETAVVPAGTYNNCVKIHETTSGDPVYYKDYWVDKNVGIVRTEGTTQEDYPVIVIESLKTIEAPIK